MHWGRSSGAVFWQGRRHVTCGYDRQGPEPWPVMDSLAVRLHWNHSITRERDFLPEWQAQLHASTLAAELGCHHHLVVDVFALPLRHKPNSAKVTFDEEIVVFMGLQDDLTFHQVTMQHTTLSSWQGKPWTVRARPLPDLWRAIEAEDHVSLMARRPIRQVPSDGDRSSETATSFPTSSSRLSQSSWRQTVLVLLNGQMLPARLPWNDGDALAVQISQIVVGIDTTELMGVHFVPNRPSDLVQQELQCLLLQVRSDVRPSQFMKLILIDLEIYEPNEILPGAFRRFSKWLPIEHSDDSRLWHNNVLVPDGQISPMHLGDGDFLKIVIGHREGSPACSETDISSFSLESDTGEVDSISALQTCHQPHVSMPSFADADPPSFQAVCISGSCETFHGQPRVQSMNEPFSFFASQDSNRAREQPGRPPRVQSPLWQQEIWDLLCDEGATEMEEEGPIIYVRSFFISHINTPINRVSRPLRFDVEHETWEASARFMWEDFVDPQAPLELFIAHPDPPTTIFEGTVATVDVVQHPVPHKAAIVITALPDAPEVRHARHVALSADPAVTQAQLVAAAEVQDLCNTPGCSTWIGSRELPVDEHIRTHDGLGLQIKIPAQRLDMTQRSTDLIAAHSLQAVGHHDNGLDDDHDELMMISLQINSFNGALTQTMRLLNTDTIEQPECNFEVPVLDAHQRQTQENPAENSHLDDVHETWLRASPVFAVSADEAAVTFTSWFVHSHLWTTCDHPRMLTLFPQRHEWDSQIRSLWRDRMQPGQPFEVSIVSPASEDDSRSCNILVYQGPTNRHRGIVLSTFRHADTSQLYRKRALVVPSRISFTDLTRFADFQIECQSRAILCVGFFGSESLDDDRPIFPCQGAHLELHLVDWDAVPIDAGQSPPYTESDDIDATSLMHASYETQACQSATRLWH